MHDKNIHWDSFSKTQNASAHPEVAMLLARLAEIHPKSVAQALYHLESRKLLPSLFFKNPSLALDQTELYFSRGLVHEIGLIYVRLASHLQKQSEGSQELMHSTFELFRKTLLSLTEIKHLISPN